ncbi:sugar phosphate nucleotidyltransferase [Kitasatospora misakiensis]|uniref:Sugar phosphate nucleotidyltransferase n=1 Tax=Kitasatospora misakiensis TaxID=67330 RepID=A0ABW0XGX1_9ACTN
MKTQNSTAVVIAAGGLGTRVAGWSTFMPKEFRPVEGRPGIVHVLQEAEAGGARRAVVVHHPYYAGLASWSAQVFGPGGTARYQQLAQQSGSQQSSGLHVDFIAQRGPYADVTSALNGSSHLRTGDICLVFSDNVDPAHRALAELVDATDPTYPAVLTSPFDITRASTHGVVVCTGTGPVRTMAALVEKPDFTSAARLVADHGVDRLRLLQGRMRITSPLLHHLAATARHARRAEPKVSLGLASYARNHRVQVVTSTVPMVDLGVPDPERAAAS